MEELINSDINQMLAVENGLAVLSDDTGNCAYFDKNDAKKIIKFLTKHLETGEICK